MGIRKTGSETTIVTIPSDTAKTLPESTDSLKSPSDSYQDPTAQPVAPDTDSKPSLLNQAELLKNKLVQETIGYDDLFFAISNFSEIIQNLNLEDRSDSINIIMRHITNEAWEIRKLVVQSITANIPFLKNEERLNWVFTLVDNFKDEDSVVRRAVEVGIQKSMVHLSESDRFQIAMSTDVFLDSEYWITPAVIRIVAPYLNESHLEELTQKMLARLGGDKFVSEVSLKCLAEVVPFLKENERLGVALKILNQFQDADTNLKSVILTSLLKIIRKLNNSDQIELVKAVWQHNLLLSIKFTDGGISASFWSHFCNAVLPELKAPEVEPVSFAEISRLSESDSNAEGKKYGRSIVGTMAEGALQVFKALNRGQSLQDLLRELAFATRFADFGLWSPLIKPVGVVEADKKSGIAFNAPRNYYLYLTDDEMTLDKLKQGLFNAIHDVFLLAKKGYYHLVPIRLFHNAEPGNEDRPSGDFGRYTWMPDLVFGQTAIIGMGCLDNWNESIKFGNYSQEGIRDLEEVATLTEIKEGREKYAPELRPLRGKANLNALYDMALLGNHLFAGVLYIGNYIRKVAQAENEQTFWKDDSKLKPYADLLHEMFSLAHEVKYSITNEQAKEIMKDKADWTKLARQLAFFMTKAYVPFVKPGSKVTEFPLEIYGRETQLEITQKDYLDNSYNEENGWVGTGGQSDQLSLGSSHGPFPVREFEAAAYATFIPWSGMGMLRN